MAAQKHAPGKGYILLNAIRLCVFGKIMLLFFSTVGAQVEPRRSQEDGRRSQEETRRSRVN